MYLPFILTVLFIFHFPQTSPTAADANDAAVMQILAKSISADTILNWSTSDPCTPWTGVQCYNGKITAIQLHDGKKLSGSLPPQIRNLASLVRLEFPSSNISGPLPSLKGLSALQAMYLNDNSFNSVPDDFFDGLISLREVYMDRNPFKQWEIPAGLSGSSSLVNFSASSANVAGGLPAFFSGFAALDTVNLALNDFSGHGLPRSLENSSARVLWLNGCNMIGRIDVISRVNNLKEISLQKNAFTGPIPNFPENSVLQILNLRDNKLTGVVPSSLTSLQSLKTVNLTNNLLQGQKPKFSDSVALDMIIDTERFCLPTGDPCDETVNILLNIVSYFGYPYNLAASWKDNNPCAGWIGITCDPSGNVTRVDFPKMNLTGSISQDFQKLGSLQKLNLSNNKISGTIPPDLVNLKQLTLLDVSNNDLSGLIPNFSNKVQVITSGNPNIGIELPPSRQNTPSSTTNDRKNVGVIAGSIIGVSVVITIAIIVIVYYKTKKKLKYVGNQLPSMVSHPRRSGSDASRIKISAASHNGGNGTDQMYNRPVNVQVIGDPVNLAISVQVLRDATDNFNQENILGRGGFGTVYKGVYPDGKTVAVKRMESGAVGSTGLDEFKSEISILTKVRHRHLVSLLGYCLEDNEKILVYEYMSQGTLSQHLFDWAKHSAKPLDWDIRLSISLDVARGVEYLHSLMNESFVHRDLKPSNILLGDDMRAKVADFGLVRLAPEGKNVSVATRLAGTFGYLAPEYAVTGRVTAKSDVFSYGVILMELITGKKALDESIPDENSHLVTWFRRMLQDINNLPKLVDPSIDITNVETYTSVKTASELAGHCCARDPHSRPDMSHAVSTLTSIVEKWNPSTDPPENVYDFSRDIRRSLENFSHIGHSLFSDDTNTDVSIPQFNRDTSGR